MRVLITGAGGSLGTVLAPRLAQAIGGPGRRERAADGRDAGSPWHSPRLCRRKPREHGG